MAKNATTSAELPRDVGGDNLRAWLEKSPEDAIDPLQPIIDPHLHLFDRRPRRTLPDGARTHLRYLGDDLMEDIRGGGHNVIDTVFVECLSMYREDSADPLRAVGEVQFAQGVAAMAASGLYGEGVRCCGGIVGFADLTLGAGVEPILRALKAAGENFRGIRHSHAWHESSAIANSHHPTSDISGLLGRDDFREGFAVLDKLGLTFDCWGYHTQLAEVADLAAAFPGVTIVLNHIGGPLACGPYEGQRTAQVFDTWESSVRLVAAHPNVVVKVGGFGMPNYGFDYTVDAAGPPSSQRLAEAWKPYVEILIDAYGPERCMFESNFPVDKVAYSYTSLWNAFKLIATDLSMTSAQKNDLFFGTAARAYSLTLP